MLMMLSIVGVSAQNKQEIPLWPAGTAHTSEPSYMPVLTVYPAARPNGQAIIMCPGGGYGHLAINHEGHDMAAWFNNQGITFAVLKYRLPADGHNYPLDDAAQAMRLMRRNAGQWEVDREKIGIMGASAGGHLATTLTNLCPEDSLRPAFHVLFYPVISMDETITNKGTHDNLIGKNPAPALRDRYSMEQQVTGKTPPCFLMLSADDGVNPENSLRYFRALRQKNIPAALHIYPSGGHGWGFRDTFLYKPEWTEELSKWLRTADCMGK